MAKISKVNLALIPFITLLLVSIFAQISYQAQMWSSIEPSYAIHVDNLAEKPENYFVLSNPDQYVTKVLDGEERYVIVHYDDTQIDELVRQYGTNNIEYNGTYYAIGIAFVDAFPPPTLPYILAGFAISILGTVIVLIFQVVKRFKPKKQISSQCYVYAVPPRLFSMVSQESLKKNHLL